MFTINTRLVRRPLAGLIAGAAVAALLAVASPARAAGYFPIGDVDGVINGAIWYVGVQPPVTGWAADGDAPKLAILVGADVTWTKTSCSGSSCTTSVVARQTLNAQRANLFRSDLLGEVSPTDVPWGPYHGFSFTLPPAPVPAWAYDTERVCLTAFNTGPGANRSLGCYALNFV
jgi:hypothetical protein